MATPARRTRDDLRNLILDAAAEVIDREGFGVTSSTVTYKQVFDHLENEHGIRVTRGSVHERIWASQHDFQLEVLRRTARWDARTSTERTSEALRRILDEGRAADRAPWAILTKMARVGGQVNYRSADEDDLYFAWTGLTLAMAQALADDSDAHEALAHSVTESYSSLTDDFIEIFRGVFDQLGLRIRSDLFTSTDDAHVVFTKLTTAMSEGVSLRRRFDESELPELELRTGPDGSLQTWHPFAVGLLALLTLFVEVDPEGSDGD